jgi:hypothetical protein
MEQLFEMTDEQHARIMKASQPTPVMYLSGGQSMCGSPQENANSAWQGVAKELGFKWDTARPAPGKPDHFILANSQ